MWDPTKIKSANTFYGAIHLSVMGSFINILIGCGIPPNLPLLGGGTAKRFDPFPWECRTEIAVRGAIRSYSSPEIFFKEQVHPILLKNCNLCHKPDGGQQPFAQPNPDSAYFVVKQTPRLNLTSPLDSKILLKAKDGHCSQGGANKECTVYQTARSVKALEDTIVRWVDLEQGKSVTFDDSPFTDGNPDCSKALISVGLSNDVLPDSDNIPTGD
jgi:hypothetical protein